MCCSFSFFCELPLAALAFRPWGPLRRHSCTLRFDGGRLTWQKPPCDRGEGVDVGEKRLNGVSSGAACVGPLCKSGPCNAVQRPLLPGRRRCTNGRCKCAAASPAFAARLRGTPENGGEARRWKEKGGEPCRAILASAFVMHLSPLQPPRAVHNAIGASNFLTLVQHTAINAVMRLWSGRHAVWRELGGNEIVCATTQDQPALSALGRSVATPPQTTPAHGTPCSLTSPGRIGAHTGSVSDARWHLCQSGRRARLDGRAWRSKICLSVIVRERRPTPFPEQSQREAGARSGAMAAASASAMEPLWHANG